MIIDEMTSMFWMVYGMRQGAPTVRHKTRESAIEEASRLARNNPGIEFFVMEAIKKVVKRDVDITHLVEIGPGYEDDGIPF